MLTYYKDMCDEDEDDDDRPSDLVKEDRERFFMLKKDVATCIRQEGSDNIKLSFARLGSDISEDELLHLDVLNAALPYNCKEELPFEEITNILRTDTNIAPTLKIVCTHIIGLLWMHFGFEFGTQLVTAEMLHQKTWWRKNFSPDENTRKRQIVDYIRSIDE